MTVPAGMRLPGGGHSARATVALRRLGELDPGLGALALWCRHRDGEGALAAWTEGETIRYGPAFAALPAHEQVGLAAHHVLHVAFRHASRAGALGARLGAGFDEDVFNAAADALINEALILAGHALPRPCVTLAPLLATAGIAASAPAALGRYDAEALYLALMTGRGRDGAARAGAGDAAAREDAEGAAQAAALRAAAEAQGFRRDLRAPSRGGEGSGEDRAAAEWRQRVARAMAAGRSAGRGLGALAVPLADLPRPRVPWERLLRRLVTRAVERRPRPAMIRPARHWIAREADAVARGAPRPGYEGGVARDRSVPRIAVCVDASASIDDARLARFAAEVAGIGRRSGAEVHVIVFDEAVRTTRRMQGRAWEAEIRQVPFVRGGGTDFRPALAAAAGLAPSAIVVLSDLDGPLGPAPGRVPVVWAVPGAPPAMPPFGRLVRMED